jgi:membrane-bound lytic murein transglycosylase MltF
MIAIDTKEKLDWLLEALENNEIQIVSGGLTEEEKKEFSVVKYYIIQLYKLFTPSMPNFPVAVDYHF